jgi:1-acyl-sn-glycerol-3-phosphate acyltransferase
VLFWLIKIYARFCLQIYCRKIVLNKQDYVAAKGPILFAANHPNSFLDGILLTTLLKEPVWSLARGDAFKNARAEKLLRWLHLLPVYRTSEGVENLTHNYTTFASCQEVFQKDGIVLIFSEGRCINEWRLRPLKKGTARLAISSWQKDIPLTVVPLGFNYSSFRTFGKVVHLNFGTPLNSTPVLEEDRDGKQMAAFNAQLEAQLKDLVYEFPLGDKKAIQKQFSTEGNPVKTILLLVPALLGFLIHAPLYFLVKKTTDHWFDNDHYDSVITSLLMIGYLFYWPLVVALSGFIFGASSCWAAVVLVPFSAWAFVQLKYDWAN